MSATESAATDHAAVALPRDETKAAPTLGRKSVLVGMLASGFVLANASHSSAVAAGETKPFAASHPAYLPRWAPDTPYVRGEQVVSPNNDVVSAKVTHSSSSAYATDTLSWALSSSYAPSVGLPIYAAQYGVSGDPAVDSTVAFATALTQVVGPRRRVILPPGQVKITRTIAITASMAGLTIEGEKDNRPESAGGGTAINFYGTGPVFDVGTDDAAPWDAPWDYNGPRGFTLRGLLLRAYSGTTAPLGDGLGGGASYLVGTYGVRSWRGGDIRFDNVRLERFEYGFWGIKADFSSWRNVDFWYCKTGMFLGPRCDQGAYDNLTFVFCARAIEIASAMGITFRSPRFVNVGNFSTNPIKVTPGGFSRGNGTVVFDGPWLENGATAMSGTYEAWFEIGENSANQPTGNVVIREPQLLSGRIGTAGATCEFSHLVKVANVRLVEIVNPTGYGAANFKVSFVKAIGSASPMVCMRGPANTLDIYRLLTNSGTGTPGVIAETVVNGHLKIRSSDGASVLLQQQASTTDLKVVLVQTGLLATGGATPLDLNGGTATAGGVKITGASAQLTIGNPNALTPAIIDTPSGVTNVRFKVANVEVYRTTANEIQMGEGKNIKAGTVKGTMLNSAANQKLAFWGAVPVVRPTGTPAAATTPATTQALVNNLRAKLITLGLIG